MNLYAVAAIYRFEMNRTFRTLWQSIVSPVVSTSLYFVVFGAVRAGGPSEIDGIPYGAFIVPGLIMLSLFTQSIFNASFAIFFPKFIGTIYELLSAPVSFVEVIMAYVGAAATKSVMLGLIILATAFVFAPHLAILHPLLMLVFLVLTSLSFSLFGFIIGVLSKNFEEIQFIPMLIVTPMTFLGGAFYSITKLPQPWQTISHFNPAVYLISGFRWTFFGKGDVPVIWSLAFIFGFFAVCLVIVSWIFKTGYKIKV